jgi:hypothetical protein
MLLLLGACTLLAPDADNSAAGADRGAGDWLELGARAQGMSPAELDVSLAQARASYRAEPSAPAAIRLAILLSSPRNPDRDPAMAEMLLARVEDSDAASAGDRAFAAFYRPVAALLASQQAALDAADADAELLRKQLDALRELEEQLDAED